MNGLVSFSILPKGIIYLGDSIDENNFPHILLLTNTQVPRLCKAFANNSPANIKLSKTQLHNRAIRTIFWLDLVCKNKYSCILFWCTNTCPKKGYLSGKTLGIIFVGQSDDEISIFKLIIGCKNYVNHRMWGFVWTFCLKVALSDKFFVCWFRIFCHFCPIR